MDRARRTDDGDDSTNTRARRSRGGGFLTSSDARALDDDLTSGALAPARALEELMRDAGAQSARAIASRTPSMSFCVLCGPGNNGGDGLVLARTIAREREGATVKVWYPTAARANELFATLVKECEREPNVEFVDEAFVLDALDRHLVSASRDGNVEINVECFVDAIFGFSFKGDVREPFIQVMDRLARVTNGKCGDESTLFTASIDIPSGWNVDDDGAQEHEKLMFMPNLLVSLTAPKKCCAGFDDPRFDATTPRHWRVKRMAQTHIVAGTFLTPELCEKYGLHEIPLRSDSTIDFAPLDLSRR